MTAALILWVTIGTVCLQDAGATASRDPRIVRAIQASVYAKNFTYYSMQIKSQFTVVLDSIKGDADLYISENDRQPHYQNLDYNISSNTCGRELIVIPDTLKRPIVAGVLGHEQYLISEYNMVILMGEVHPDDAAKIVAPAPDSNSKQSKSDEKQSLLWDIVSFILKLIVEILL